MSSRALVEVRAARKAQLIQKLRFFEQALFDAEIALREANRKSEKEHEEVDELEDVGAGQLLLSLAGQYDERLAKEKREAAEAKMLAAQRRHQRDRLQLEVQRVRAGIDTLGAPETALAKVDDDRRSADRAAELVRVMGALEEIYEAQDALRLLRDALKRAERWANLTRGRSGPAYAHARSVGETAQDRLGRFEDELTGVWHALRNLGSDAPHVDLPEPGTLHEELVNAWRRHSSLSALDGRWDRLGACLATAAEQIETRLERTLEGEETGTWNVGSLFLPSA
jgi:hypothetical protein